MTDDIFKNPYEDYNKNDEISDIKNAKATAYDGQPVEAETGSKQALSPASEAEVFSEDVQNIEGTAAGCNTKIRVHG